MTALPALAILVSMLLNAPQVNIAPAPTAESIQKLTAQAERGSTDAMYRLALAHETGRGVPQDMEIATTWFIKAAQRGHGMAMLRVGNAYENGEGVDLNLAKAHQWYEKAAGEKILDAMINLGYAYDRGIGVEQDPVRAISWFRKAADAQLPLAVTYLGIAYDTGRGVKKDQREAVKWFQKAAALGSAYAIYRVGVYYRRGEGVEKDSARAFTLIKAAADASAVSAMADLGSMYLLGEGTPQNFERALTSLSQAAALQSQKAMFVLGRMYRDGEGVTADAVKAFMWFDLAARYSSSQLEIGLINKFKSQLAAQMLPEQIEEGQKRSQYWRPAPLPIGGGVRPPSFLTSPSQRLLAARHLLVPGGVNVLTEFVVDIDGTASDIRVVESSPRASDEDVIRAVQQWRFQPAIQDGTRVAVVLRLRLWCNASTCVFNVESPAGTPGRAPASQAATQAPPERPQTDPKQNKVRTVGAYRPGAGITLPVALNEVKPAYTAEAMRERIEGSVLLECIVMPDGSVSDVKVMRSLDPTFGLDREAVKAAKEWRFRPGMSHGEPVPVIITMELSFTLKG